MSHAMMATVFPVVLSKPPAAVLDNGRLLLLSAKVSVHSLEFKVLRSKSPECSSP